MAISWYILVDNNAYNVLSNKGLKDKISQIRCIKEFKRFSDELRVYCRSHLDKDNIYTQLCWNWEAFAKYVWSYCGYYWLEEVMKVIELYKPDIELAYELRNSDYEDFLKEYDELEIDYDSWELLTGWLQEAQDV